MIRHLCCALAGAVLWPALSSADLPLMGDTAVHFASISEGRTILTRKDDFIQRLSPFDRSARMKVAHAVSEDDFLAFVGKNVVAWTADETRTVENAIKKLQPFLRAFPLSFPPTIHMIKTTGAEEGNAAYTRETAIVLPSRELIKNEDELAKLICHELFHILTRQNPEVREELYAAIGFTKCDDIVFPPSLQARKITNPDAPRNDHFIRLEADGQERLAVPILFATDETYNVERGGEFFNYLTFRFLIARAKPGSSQLEPTYENSVPKLLAPEAVSGFYEQIGKNTPYIIHPEEVLADNFALLILGEQDVPSPGILRKMKEVLARARKG